MRWLIKFKTEHPDVYNIITRALWTFIQAFLGAIIILPSLNMEKEAFWSMIVGAIGAGLSAVKTVIVEWIAKKAERKEEGDA